jgi:serine/threonine protein kinase
MIEAPTTNRSLNKYLVGKTLGTGTFKVKALFDPTTQQTFAAKICQDCLQRSILSKEASIISTINQAGIPNVIQIVDYLENREIPIKKKGGKAPVKPSNNYEYKAVIIMELAINGTIFDYVDYSKGFNDKLARSYMKELFITVNSLHNLGYVHRDIKLENILLDEHFKLKLSDFGFAKEFDENTKERMSTRLGTEYYMAPEMRRAARYSGVKTDVFACGVALFIMVLARPPWHQATPNDPLYKFFFEETPEKFWEIVEKKLNNGKEINNGLKLMLNDMFMPDPQRRPPAEKLFEYEWMQREVCGLEDLYHTMGKIKKCMDDQNKQH